MTESQETRNHEVAVLVWVAPREIQDPRSAHVRDTALNEEILFFKQLLSRVFWQAPLICLTCFYFLYNIGKYPRQRFCHRPSSIPCAFLLSYSQLESICHLLYSELYITELYNYLSVHYFFFTLCIVTFRLQDSQQSTVVCPGFGL